MPVTKAEFKRRIRLAIVHTIEGNVSFISWEDLSITTGIEITRIAEIARMNKSPSHDEIVRITDALNMKRSDFWRRASEIAPILAVLMPLARGAQMFPDGQDEDEVGGVPVGLR